MSEVNDDNKNWLKQCHGCKCSFFSKHDMHQHLKAFAAANHEEALKSMHRQVEHEEQEGWIPSRYGDGAELLPVEKDSKLAQHLKHSGIIQMGGCTYKLSTNQKWIVKTPTGAC